MVKPSDTSIITKNKFNTQMEFSQHIEKMASNSNSSHMDCIIDFCERNEIDIEVVSKLVTKSLKSKIRLEAEERNLLTKKSSPKLL